MLGVSSIACKNNSTNNDSPPPEVKNYASLSLTSDSITNLIVKQDGKTFNSEITIKFTDATSTTLSSATDDKDATVENVTYTEGKVAFQETSLTSLTDTPVTYKLTFAVVGENTNATITVPVKLQKTKLVTKDVISAAMASVVYSDGTYTFNFVGASTSATYGETDVTLKDEGGESIESSELGLADFISGVSSAAGSDATFLGTFKSITLAAKDSNTTAAGKEVKSGVFTLTFDPQPEYELGGSFAYSIKFDSQVRGKWK